MGACSFVGHVLFFASAKIRKEGREKMIVTFFGHRSVSDGKELERRVLQTLEEICDPAEAHTFYCGGYGAFDSLCARACRAFKQESPKSEVILVLPYLNRAEALPAKSVYDGTIYPPLEGVPLRFAILRRNEWMAKQADVVIAYVKTCGGAEKSLAYAERLKKRIIRL